MIIPKSAVTAALLALTGLAVPAPAAVAAGAPPGQQLTVDLANSTGPVFHGADGALYGLSENGVPGADLLGPLHIRAIDAAPPGAQQHPTGHADQVAPEFFGMGGQRMLVYLRTSTPPGPTRTSG